MDTCQSIYQASRKNAGFTQEQAAEFLNIAPRTLGGYETGTAPVPDDIADRMVTLYRDELLGYLHLLKNPIARRFLPEIEQRSLSQAALAMMCATIDYQAVQAKMMMLAADGRIDQTEAKEWDEVHAAHAAVVKSAFTLRFARKD